MESPCAMDRCAAASTPSHVYTRQVLHTINDYRVLSIIHIWYRVPARIKDLAQQATAFSSYRVV